jgi:hypothetical protein
MASLAYTNDCKNAALPKQNGKRLISKPVTTQI